MGRINMSLQITPELCQSCKYGSYNGNCNYILMEGHSRIFARNKKGQLVRLVDKGRCITYKEGGRTGAKIEKMCY